MSACDDAAPQRQAVFGLPHLFVCRRECACRGLECAAAVLDFAGRFFLEFFHLADVPFPHNDFLEQGLDGKYGVVAFELQLFGPHGHVVPVCGRMFVFPVEQFARGTVVVVEPLQLPRDGVEALRQVLFGRGEPVALLLQLIEGLGRQTGVQDSSDALFECHDVAVGCCGVFVYLLRDAAVYFRSREFFEQGRFLVAPCAQKVGEAVLREHHGA